MSLWEVYSKNYMTYWFPGHLDPPEWTCDWAMVEADSAREAKVKAVREWRRQGTDRIFDCQSDKASPFTGLTATVMVEGPQLDEVELPETP